MSLNPKKERKTGTPSKKKSMLHYSIDMSGKSTLHLREIAYTWSRSRSREDIRKQHLAREELRKRAEKELNREVVHYLISSMSTPNVKRMAEGQSPLNWGRGEEFDEKDFRDLGNIPSWMQDMAEKELKRREKTIPTPKKIRDPITVIRNNMGHVHVFQGDVRDEIQDYGNQVTLDGEDSPVYIQVDYDVEALKGYMTPEQLDDFEGGFAIIMEDIGYF
jgi:hypothetical protein